MQKREREREREIERDRESIKETLKFIVTECNCAISIRNAQL